MNLLCVLCEVEGRMVFALTPDRRGSNYWSVSTVTNDAISRRNVWSIYWIERW